MNLYANISKQKIRKSMRKISKENLEKRKKENVAFNNISNNV